MQMRQIDIIWPSVANGIAVSLIFVPLTTTTMGQLRQEQIGNASGIYNLMRNLGGSFGIAAVTTIIDRASQMHQAAMVTHLTPRSDLSGEAGGDYDRTDRTIGTLGGKQSGTVNHLRSS